MDLLFIGIFRPFSFFIGARGWIYCSLEFFPTFFSEHGRIYCSFFGHIFLRARMDLLFIGILSHIFLRARIDSIVHFSATVLSSEQSLQSQKIRQHNAIRPAHKMPTPREKIRSPSKQCAVPTKCRSPSPPKKSDNRMPTVFLFRHSFFYSPPLRQSSSFLHSLCTTLLCKSLLGALDVP